MIISCEQCETHFQLDDARIPAGGVRVRCSRCQHGFFVAPQSEAPQAEAAPAPATSSAATPEDDAPWEFNEDTPESADDTVLEADEIGELMDDEVLDVGDDMEILDDSTLDPAANFGDLNAEAQELGASFQAMAEEVARDQAPEEVAEGASLAADATEDLLGELSQGLDAGSTAPSPAPADDPEPSLDELGSPETWALVSEPPAEPPREEPFGTGFAAVSEPPLDPTPVPASPGTRSARDRLGGAAQGVVWIAFAVVLAWVAAPQLVSWRSGAPLLPDAVQVGPLLAEDLAVRRIENRFGGPLIVVSGRLRNPSAEIARVGQALRVRIAGDPRETATVAAWVGGPIPEAALREARPAALDEHAARRASRLGVMLLGPGRDTRFEALFTQPPERLVSLELESVPLAQLPGAARF